MPVEIRSEPSITAEEEMLRAQGYALLARLLAAPPDSRTLEAVRGLSGDGTMLGRAIGALAAIARETELSRARDEYAALFIGVTRGELLPYASFYLTGFLHERPLAVLRGDMIRLGIARAPDVPEPEDHIGALCETMAGLIDGRFGAPVSLTEQRRFFDTHIGCWAPRFFQDLERAEPAVFYRAVGSVGRAFMDIETQAFALAA